MSKGKMEEQFVRRSSRTTKAPIKLVDETLKKEQKRRTSTKADGTERKKPGPKKGWRKDTTDDDQAIVDIMADDIVEEDEQIADIYDEMEISEESAFEDDDDDSDVPAKKRSYKRRQNTSTKPKKTVVKKPSNKPLPRKLQFDPELVEQLAKEYPDDYWVPFENADPIKNINRDHLLLPEKTLNHQGAVYALKLSPDLSILASCSNLGSIKLWNTENWTLIAELRDENEKNIEEFFVMCWSDDGQHIIAGGKLKSRQKWSEQDEDNHILPCPLKIFNVISGKVVDRLEGHSEEIVCLKKLKFQGKSYLLTASEDGRMIKWLMNDNYSKSIKWQHVDDMTTNMAISLSFLPDCGNKYYLAACDEGVKLFDFEHGRLIHSWPNVYSYLCDNVKFVDCEELPSEDGEYYVLTKGVELLNESDNSEVLFPNKCILHKLTFPKSSKDPWKFEEVHRFEHDDYHANLWLLQLTSNGIYVAAPTTVGKVFIWNLRSKELTAVISCGQAEVRDIVFHPTKKVLICCGDESTISVFEQKPLPEGYTLSDKGRVMAPAPVVDKEVAIPAPKPPGKKRGRKRKEEVLALQQQQQQYQ